MWTTGRWFYLARSVIFTRRAVELNLNTTNTDAQLNDHGILLKISATRRLLLVVA